MDSSSLISSEAIERFQIDGAVCLRAVIDPCWIELLRTATEAALANPGAYHHVQSAEDDPGYFFTEYYVTRRLDGFRRFVYESPAARLASELMRSDSARFFFDGLFVKEPATVKRSQGHQDQPYYPIDGTQVAILWLPLDPVSEQTSLQIVKGSHRSGKWFHPVLFRNDRQLAGADSRYEPVPDVDADRTRLQILSWDMHPGDCIAFHGLALHGAPGNPGEQRRRALSTTWLGDDTVFGARSGELEPHFKRLQYPVGSVLTDPMEFPLVWMGKR